MYYTTELHGSRVPDDRVPKKVGKRQIADWFKLVKKISTKKAKGILAPQHFTLMGEKLCAN